MNPTPTGLAPEAAKLIPAVLHGLPWQKYDDNLRWYDGTELLVVVETKTGRDLDSVQIEVDEDYFRVSQHGEYWGWEIDDVSYFVVLDGHQPVMENEEKNGSVAA